MTRDEGSFDTINHVTLCKERDCLLFLMAFPTSDTPDLRVLSFLSLSLLVLRKASLFVEHNSYTRQFKVL